MSEEKENSLTELDKQIELKKQELEALKMQEAAKTERLGLGGILAIALVALAGAAAAGVAESKSKKRRLF